MITISDIRKRIAAGESVRAIVEQTIAKIKTVGDYNAIIDIAEERALERADQIDARLAAGEEVGTLAGIPFIAKDVFLTFGTTTTAASNMLRDFKAPYQSTVIERLEAAGAIMVAKANLDAFAHGASTENSDFGTVKNPHDGTRVAGGSSGGSAVVVALDLVPFSLGTDTGGSTRQPASFCGIYGIKPTYGAMSRYGIVAMGSSTDTVGIFAHTASDGALVFDVMGGRDSHDSTTLPERPASYLPFDNPVGKLRVGVIREYMTDKVQPEVLDAVKVKIADMIALGHEVEEVSLPSVELGLAVYYIVIPAEVSSNLQRYDGIKFGYSSQKADGLQQVYNMSREMFNAENKRRIMIGTYVLSSGFIDAYYRKAQTVRTKIINEFRQAFEKYDVLIGPVAPTTAFKIGQNASDPLQMYLADVMTVAASMAGLPAMSVPAGTDDSNMPIGLQLIGNQKDDAKLLALAEQLEGQK